MKNISTRLWTVASTAMLLYVGSATMNAEVLTPDQALSRVTATSPDKVKSINNVTQATLALTQNIEGAPALYVFNNNGGGYMVVSADDVAPALLGYSDNGTFDAAKVNPELQWWLGEYARQIAWARNMNMPATLDAKSAETASRQAIAPMTTTRWNQDAPFNDDCPEVGGTRCVTGCVATALSQIMKYHNWPATGTGSNSYTCSATGSTLSVDFASTTYDWDNMINVYDASATSAQKAAVATLMYSAGVAVNMDYTTSESSATSFAAAQAMVNYFDYDKRIMFYDRDYYTIGDWNDLVYNQLKTYGPVQYSGQSNDGGHSFVCDGYSQDGYFHINWGWGGMSDGYFLLTALNPTSQGIGGSTSGYNFDQDIIGNVRPASAGSTSQIAPNFVAQQFTPSSSTVSLGDEVMFSGPIYSYSLANVSGAMGVKLTDSSDNVTYIKGSAFNNMEPEYGVNGFYVTLPATLAAGTYRIAPAVADNAGRWYDMPVLVGAEQAESMTVSEGTATFTTLSASSLSISDVTAKTDFYIGAKFEMTATVKNTGAQEYLGGIRLMLINSNSQAVAEGDEYPLDLQGGESSDITYLSAWTAASAATLSAGTYYICFVDGGGNQLSDMQTVTLNAQQTPSLTLSDFTITGGTTGVDRSNIEFTGTLNVASGYFGNTLSLVIFPYTSGSVSSVASYATDAMFIGAGGSQTFTVKADFSNGTPGSTYFAMLYDGSTPAVDNQLVFTLRQDPTDRVDNINGDSADADDVVDTQCYTISGVRVTNRDSLTPGVYIVRQTLSDGTVNVSKVVR